MFIIIAHRGLNWRCFRGPKRTYFLWIHEGK